MNLLHYSVINYSDHEKTQIKCNIFHYQEYKSVTKQMKTAMLSLMWCSTNSKRYLEQGSNSTKVHPHFSFKSHTHIFNFSSIFLKIFGIEMNNIVSIHSTLHGILSIYYYKSTSNMFSQSLVFLSSYWYNCKSLIKLTFNPIKDPSLLLCNVLLYFTMTKRFCLYTDLLHQNQFNHFLK